MSFTAQHPYLDTTNDYTPINDMAVVVPSDSQPLPGGTCKALIFMGAGTVKIMTAMGNVVTLTIGSTWFGIQYIRAQQIFATGTTISAGNIVACY